MTRPSPLGSVWQSHQGLSPEVGGDQTHEVPPTAEVAGQRS